MIAEQNTIVERKSYPGLDILKFLCSIVIIFLHINPFQGTVRFITKAIGNLGVPCFFIISGFLLFRKLYATPKDEQNKIFFKQIKRLAILLGFWLIVYFLVCDFWWIRDGNITENLLDYGRRILFGGSGFFLWYIVSLMFGITITYFLWRKIKEYTLILSFVFFLIGAIPFAYQPLIIGSFFEKIYLWYIDCFYTTRNGIFFAFPCLSAGMFIAKKERKIQMLGKRVLYFLLPAICLFVGECFLVYNLFQDMINPMQISVIVLSFALVIAFLQVNKKIRGLSWMRKISFLNYVIHPLWISLIPKLLSPKTATGFLLQLKSVS